MKESLELNLQPRGNRNLDCLTLNYEDKDRPRERLCSTTSDFHSLEDARKCGGCSVLLRMFSASGRIQSVLLKVFREGHHQYCRGIPSVLLRDTISTMEGYHQCY